MAAEKDAYLLQQERERERENGSSNRAEQIYYQSRIIVDVF